MKPFKSVTKLIIVSLVAICGINLSGHLAKASIFIHHKNEVNSGVLVKWLDNSLEDWAGAIGRTSLEINSTLPEVTVKAQLVFEYVPPTDVSAVALKRSEGGEDLIIEGALDDFTDSEGRRIISLNNGQPIHIIMNFEKICLIGKTKENFVVELEPAEYY